MRRVLLAAALTAGLASTAHAVEGMWQPAQLPKIADNLLQEMGVPAK